ncbi:MAG: helix-turn-helix domain-containing protein [Chromatiaceae bacterium]|nr:helix-turn-helix domain-containing protein [Gammaproteobacteria bacterium]MCB1880136.1 helix-turn-helix domain-containing protein [Gammaproteobacteria bacterium]MCB1903133.1 helix-turn-helix domain-containing protein [Gammaproteobacteria bacterium]MCP5448219.1 helix-turn-helix domain-containing protein [Chromatiaceae bacterium]
MNTTVSDTDGEKQYSDAEGPGRRLRALRESENLALSRVSVLLHLSEEKLMSLEADDYAKLPGPVFIQGYLRNYARLLGVPVGPVLNAYRAASPESSRVPEIRITQLSHEVRSGHALVRLVTWGMVLGLVLLSVVWWRGYLQWPMQLSGSPENETAAVTGTEQAESEENDAAQSFPEVKVNADGEVTLALPQGGVETLEAPEETTADGGEGGVDRSGAEVNATAAAAGSIQAVKSASAEGAERSGEPAAETSQQVVIEYSGNSWSKIEDASGSFKLEGSNNAGIRRVLGGVPPYRMILGNAAAVKIYVNGQVFDISPFIRGNVARFTLDPKSQSQ